MEMSLDIFEIITVMLKLISTLFRKKMQVLKNAQP